MGGFLDVEIASDPTHVRDDASDGALDNRDGALGKHDGHENEDSFFSPSFFEGLYTI